MKFVAEMLLCVHSSGFVMQFDWDVGCSDDSQSIDEDQQRTREFDEGCKLL